MVALTNRETQVLSLIAQGYTSVGIAALLYITPDTVGDHKKAIFRKLSAANSAHAVALWMAA